VGAPPTPWLNVGTIGSLARVLADEHRCQTPVAETPGATLLGTMHQHEVQPGLFLRLNRVRDRVGLHSEARLSPCLKVALVWHGASHLRFGEHRFSLDGGHPQRAMVIALDRPTAFERQGVRGGSEHSAVVTMTPEWLRRRCAVSAPRQVLPPTEHHHLGCCTWRPSSDLVARLIALSRVSHSSPAIALEREAVTLALVGEMLTAIDSPLMRSEPSAHDWITAFDAMIGSGEAACLCQAELAGRLGMSPRQLQRRHRQHYGMALGEHLRRRRMERARDALIHETVSVESAATMAGYASAANFATAFKQAFGHSPSACRRLSRER